MLVTVLMLVGLIILIATAGNRDDAIEQNNQKVVKTAFVAALSSNQSPLSLIGQIESTNEADLRAESQGEITRVYAQLGDYVYAGSVLAEFENQAARAQVTQAEGALEAAEAQLLKIQSGSRAEEQDILVLSAEDARVALAQAQNAAIAEIENAFSSVDDALYNKVDVLFDGPRTYRPELSFVVPETQIKIDVESGRVSVGRVLSIWEDEIDSLTTSSDLQTALENAQAYTVQTQDFLDDVARAVNILRPNAEISETTIATWKANVSSARTTLNATINALISEVNALNGTETALAVATTNKDIGFSGGRNEDVQAAQAQVKQAKGALAVARANFEKTIIRTPISGTLNRFAVKRGDFVTLYEPIAVVSNNNALLIKTYMTEEDRREIAVGANVLVEGVYNGTVTAIAPGIDPITKKIEATVSIQEEDSTLQNGESVRIDIVRKDVTAFNANDPIRVPISALKIEPTRTVVFSLDENNALVAHPVTVGLIVGDKVIIEKGITPDMSIVVDARGLKEGQVVEKQNNQ